MVYPALKRILAYWGEGVSKSHLPAYVLSVKLLLLMHNFFGCLNNWSVKIREEVLERDSLITLQGNRGVETSGLDIRTIKWLKS